MDSFGKIKRNVIQPPKCLYDCTKPTSMEITLSLQKAFDPLPDIYQTFTTTLETSSLLLKIILKFLINCNVFH